MPKTNIRDVASHAGVSIATVSHVINNTRYVKEETRQRVLASIKALNYSPNALARSFKTGRHNLIAFIVPDIANPFFAAMIEEVEAVIAQQNYKLVICNTKEDSDKEAEALRVLANGMVDGFIIASTFLSYAPIAKMIPSGIPTIFVDRCLENCPCDTLYTDDYPALREGVERLISQGHTRIAFITIECRMSTTTQRMAAYKDAMAAHNLSTEGLICLASLQSRLFLGHWFPENMASVLSRQVTAIVAPNNAITSEVLTLLNQSGYLPGKDIEVLGYTESNPAQYITSDIHLVCQPADALGRAAGQQILERLNNPDLPVRRTVLSSTFVPHK